MSNKKETEKRSLEFYLNLNYPITMYPEEEGGFTVEITDLPGCLSQGETVEEAFEMIAEARELWLETAYEFGEPIPLPRTMATYSGKTMLRMPTYLHERLAENAKREGTSLNQYIVSLLSERDALKVVQSVKNELADIKEQLKQQTRTSERETPPTPYLVGESAGHTAKASDSASSKTTH